LERHKNFKKRYSLKYKRVKQKLHLCMFLAVCPGCMQFETLK
jgi:hypothetical protein